MILDIDYILDDILSGFGNYDGNPEEGIKLIESNGAQLDRLKVLMTKGDIRLTPEHGLKMESIINQQKNLINIFKSEKEDLLNKMNQVTKKNKVVNSYMNMNKESIFIDKDM